MSERDGDLKAREEGAEQAALRDTYGRTPGSWQMWGRDSIAPPPPGVLTHGEPQRLVPGRAPPLPAQVMSTYGVLPINGIGFSATFTISGNEVASYNARTVYRVPPQYVAVLRSISWAYIADSGFPFSEMLQPSTQIDVFVNDVPQGVFSSAQPTDYTIPTLSPSGPGLQSRNLPLTVSGYPVFVIAPPLALLELRWFATPAFGLGAGAVNRNFGILEGELLLTTGVPFNYEIGTQRPVLVQPIKGEAV